MKTIIVTAALMTREGRILVAQRREGDDQGLLWEFPGGKVEEEEDPRQALQRELREELGIEVEVGGILDANFYRYPKHPILLLLYRCEIKGGSPTPLGCRDIRWVVPAELKDLAMPPADEPIRSRLLSRKEGTRSPRKREENGRRSCP